MPLLHITLTPGAFDTSQKELLAHGLGPVTVG